MELNAAARLRATETPSWWLDMSAAERLAYNKSHPGAKLPIGAPYSERSPNHIKEIPNGKPVKPTEPQKPSKPNVPQKHSEPSKPNKPEVPQKPNKPASWKSGIEHRLAERD